MMVPNPHTGLHRSSPLSFTLVCTYIKGKQASVKAWHTDIETVAPVQESLSCDAFTQNDVAFVFSGASGPYGCLWARKGSSMAISPHWKKLLEAAWAESTQTLTELSVLAGDSASLGLETTKSNTTPSDVEGGGVSYTVVRQESRATYRAVLVWKLTNHITFGKITTDGPSESLTADTAPNVIYALAHKLEIANLQSLALNEYEGRLSSNNCMTELFSTHTILCPQLKEAGMKAVVADWAKIKENEPQTRIQEVIKAGDGDSYS